MYRINYWGGRKAYRPPLLHDWGGQGPPGPPRFLRPCYMEVSSETSDRAVQTFCCCNKAAIISIVLFLLSVLSLNTAQTLLHAFFSIIVRITLVE